MAKHLYQKRQLAHMQSGVSVGALSHNGASRTSQQLSSWQPFAGSADADTLLDLPMLTSRSRDLIRNNGIAAGYIQTLSDNVVGTNLRLIATPDWRLLGKTQEWAHEWAANVQAQWRIFSERTSIDASRQNNFAGLTTLFYKAKLYNGDAVALPIWQEETFDPFSTRIFLVESDRLCNPNYSVDTVKLRGGIEIDDYNRDIAYHFRTTHPGDVIAGSILPGKWERVLATTPWGRRRVIYYGAKDRIGQTRGKPVFSAVIQQFKMIDRYANAELDSAVVNAMIAAFIETPVEFEGLLAMFDSDPNKVKSWTDAKAKPSNRAKLASGSIIPLYPGEKLQAFNPARPASSFSAYMESVLRHVATGMNVPYELLLKDFSKTNYSSARAAMLEAWRYFRSERQSLVDNWATPVYELWLEEAIDKGIVDAPGFYQNRAAYTRCRWVGTGRGWVDPVKEAQAAQIRMDGQLSTLEAECAEQGTFWEEVLEQQARENRKRKELGLSPPLAVKQPPGEMSDGETEPASPGSDPADDEQSPPEGINE